MAGKRQHYVPRFLQRGFLHDPMEEAERTWLHRRGAKPKLVGIRDIGVGEYFYSKLRNDGVATLDDLITAVEGPLDGELSALRRTPPDAPVDPERAARLVTHLALRTAHLRSVFAEAAREILDGLADAFGDPEIVRGQLGVDGLDPGGALAKKIDEALSDEAFATLGIPKPLMQRIAIAVLREVFPDFFEEHVALIPQMLMTFRQDVTEHVREAHNRALQDPRDNQRQADLARLAWRLQAVEEAILPDCVALVQERTGAYAPLLLAEKEQVARVIMPIAHDRLLIGEVEPGQVLDIGDVNRASAASADDFFVARRSCADTTLGALIGTRSNHVVQAQINAALADLRNSAPRPGAPAWLAAPHTTSSFSWTLSCSGFPDDESVRHVNEILGVIVGEMARRLPLDSLDGMTFTFDYAGALAELDRGDPTLPTASTSARDYGTAVAQSVEILREGRRKSHIVIHAGVGLELLADDPARRTAAAHVVASQLADVAHGALYADQVNGRYARPADNVIRGFYPSASAAPGRYFSARESAFVDPEAGEHYASLVRDSLASLRVAVEAAKAAYSSDNDGDRLFGEILPRLSNVLSHIAEWLGHRDGIASGEFLGAELIDDLKALELDKWLELFARDLRDLHDIEGGFTPEKIFALGRHVERLLWTMHIFAWPLEDGTPWVIVAPADPPMIAQP